MPRYNIVSNSPVWCYHNMVGGATLDGAIPRTATTVEVDTVPTIRAGRADFLALTHGGLFSLVAQAKRPIVVEAVDNPGSASITLVDRNNTSLSRTAPSAPFTVGANEVIKVVGGGAGGKIGIMYRLAGEKIL